MDLNQLYFDHQLLVMKAARAPSALLGQCLQGAAGDVASRIGRVQRALGAAGAGEWEALVANDGAHAPRACRIEGLVA